MLDPVTISGLTVEATCEIVLTSTKKDIQDMTEIIVNGLKHFKMW